MEKDKENSTNIIFYILGCLMGFILLIVISFMRVENERLRQQAEFEPIKEGLCIYVEHDPWQGYTYCLVYDYDIEKVIEIDLYNELIHTDINVGDTIIYVVDYNYCDGDFLNVIKEN